MKKILVIGSGGAGKSTFSRRLGGLLGIEVIHLDALYWNPGWVETPKPEWRRKVAEVVARDSWIIDGNYSGTFDIRVEACDTIIFLDVARAVCLWRILKRTAVYRGAVRPDMARGCDERLDFEFVRWVWDYPSRTRPRVLRLLEENSRSKNVIRLRKRDEIESFLASVAATPRESPAHVAR